MQIMYLLDQLEDIIENGATLPFSNKTLVNVEEVIAIIQDIRINLPDEIKQSQWIKEERKKILVEAQKEAETIVEETENYIKKMVDENEITKNAYELAEEIIQKAQDNAKEIRLGTKEYADSILLKVQSQLQDILSTIDENRKELRR
ncbi:ATPase [Irregularibacter muris]|uniref:ATPase n=1 Tax=Irregularibacter muris TaxID=1796619 RepID=A0AAE3KYT6_9FIRM|nr:ATPase [Irregularibacter muris]MCR1898155.1 ATPase [Irregularibacter muris]